MRVSPLCPPRATKVPLTTRAPDGTGADAEQNVDCTRAYIRALTAPPIYPPLVSELVDELRAPWNVRMPVSDDDDITRIHWQEQKRTVMFEKMFDWGPSSSASASASTSDACPAETDADGNGHARAPLPSCVLQPHFSFGSPSPFNPFFAPWQDVGHCLRHLLLHQIGCHQTAQSVQLISHDAVLFLATAWNFEALGGMEDMMKEGAQISDEYYMLRCHHDRVGKKLVFGYHESGGGGGTDGGDAGSASVSKAASIGPFIPLHEISLTDDNWRLETCIALKNCARILNVLKDYAVPLACCAKLSLVHNGRRVQKIYKTDRICDVFDASVENMIDMYECIERGGVPHVDRLVSVERRLPPHHDHDHDGGGSGSVVVCQFAPVGRSYLPQNCDELLDALVCVAEALVALHALEIMHRDIRWANVFRAFRDHEEEENPHSHGDNSERGHSENGRRRRPCLEFSREWILFDFEFAARSPQPALGEHTLTPGNHAPEMIAHDEYDDSGVAQPRHQPQAQQHTTAVDIWGLGYLLRHAEVDLPSSHVTELLELRDVCLVADPSRRPTATYCLDVLRKLRRRVCSSEKEVVYC